jgi:hypothetical protein
MPKQTISSIFLSKLATAVSGISNAINLYSKSDGFIYSKDTDGLERNISTPQYLNLLSAEFPATAQVNTTRVNVPGWTFSVVSGKAYKIEVISTYNSAVTTTGGSMGLITSGGATGTINGYFNADITNATVATGPKAPLHTINTVNTTAGSFMTTSGTVVVQPVSFTCTAVFNCTASGSVNVQWGTEVGGSRAFLRIGSALIVELLN